MRWRPCESASLCLFTWLVEAVEDLLVGRVCFRSRGELSAGQPSLLQSALESYPVGGRGTGSKSTHFRSDLGLLQHNLLIVTQHTQFCWCLCHTVEIFHSSVFLPWCPRAGSPPPSSPAASSKWSPGYFPQEASAPSPAEVSFPAETRSFWAVCCCADGSEEAGLPQTSSAYVLFRQRQENTWAWLVLAGIISYIFLFYVLPFSSLRSLASSFTHLSTSGFATLSLWEGCRK